MPHTSHSTVPPRTNPFLQTTDDIALRPFVARATGSKAAGPRDDPTAPVDEFRHRPARPTARDSPPRGAPRPCRAPAPAGAGDETGGRGPSDTALWEEGDESGMGGGVGDPHIPLTDTCRQRKYKLVAFTSSVICLFTLTNV